MRCVGVLEIMGEGRGKTDGRMSLYLGGLVEVMDEELDECGWVRGSYSIGSYSSSSLSICLI